MSPEALNPYNTAVQRFITLNILPEMWIYVDLRIPDNSGPSYLAPSSCVHQKNNLPSESGPWRADQTCRLPVPTTGASIGESVRSARLAWHLQLDGLSVCPRITGVTSCFLNFKQILVALLPGVHTETIAARSRNTPQFVGYRFTGLVAAYFSQILATFLADVHAGTIAVHAGTIAVLTWNVDGDVVVFNQLLPLDATIRLRRAMVPEPEIIAKCKQPCALGGPNYGQISQDFISIAFNILEVSSELENRRSYAFRAGLPSSRAEAMPAYLELPLLQHLSGQLEAVSHDKMTKIMAFCAEISEVKAMPVYLEGYAGTMLFHAPSSQRPKLCLCFPRSFKFTAPGGYLVC
ncbi:hypothetical protein DFH07DRAFT_769380 [Mycena maculata]|uniref:Uncharacterized protein n=1 Tax=Mycena maculata TaxID=230809 RepID=A0AAD7JMN8_9AGAR|nr:hypothetical protein DFH07DRAFT_769380 [Mycena maculata]